MRRWELLVRLDQNRKGNQEFVPEFGHAKRGDSAFGFSAHLKRLRRGVSHWFGWQRRSKEAGYGEKYVPKFSRLCCTRVAPEDEGDESDHFGSDNVVDIWWQIFFQIFT